MNEKEKQAIRTLVLLNRKFAEEAEIRYLNAYFTGMADALELLL